MNLPRFNELSYAHFITSKTFRNKPIFKDDNCCLMLLKDLDYYRNRLGYKLLGYCVMPDHFHAIIWWDAEKMPDLTISIIMHDIKSHSARKITDYLVDKGRRGPLTSLRFEGSGQGTRATLVDYPHRRMSEQRYRIWQSSFYDFNIYSEEKLREKLNYIHYNPVRAGLCRNPENWPYFSYRFYMLGEKGGIEIDRI